MKLTIDVDRTKHHGLTGILVRAQRPHDDRFENADIAELDARSLHEWLRSRGGDNKWAESVVAVMLGHDMNEWETL